MKQKHHLKGCRSDRIALEGDAAKSLCSGIPAIPRRSPMNRLEGERVNPASLNSFYYKMTMEGSEGSRRQDNLRRNLPLRFTRRHRHNRPENYKQAGRGMVVVRSSPLAPWGAL